MDVLASLFPRTKLHILFCVSCLGAALLVLLWSSYSTYAASEHVTHFALVAATSSTATDEVGLWERAGKDDTVACRAYELPLVPPDKRHAPDRKPLQCSVAGSEPWVKVDNDLATVTKKGVTCEFQGELYDMRAS
jgi:hypothetical protein